MGVHGYSDALRSLPPNADSVSPLIGGAITPVSPVFSQLVMMT